MTSAEVKEEVMKDLPEIIEKKAHFLHRQDIQRLARIVKRGVAMRDYHFKSQRGNTYKMILRITSKLFLTCIYCTYMTEKGLASVNFTTKGANHMAIYTAHFFHQYRERFLREPDMEREEVIRIFHMRNYGNITYGNELDHGHVPASVPDGYCVSVIEDGVNVVITYVRPDMLKEDQKKKWMELHDLNDQLFTSAIAGYSEIELENGIKAVNPEHYKKTLKP